MFRKVSLAFVVLFFALLSLHLASLETDAKCGGGAGLFAGRHARRADRLQNRADRHATKHVNVMMRSGNFVVVQPQQMRQTGDCAQPETLGAPKQVAPK